MQSAVRETEVPQQSVSLEDQYSELSAHSFLEGADVTLEQLAAAQAVLQQSVDACKYATVSSFQAKKCRPTQNLDLFERVWQHL